MAYRIAPSDVQNRLQVTSAELPDATLNGLAFIPAAEARVDKELGGADASTTYDALDTYQQTLVKAAEIEFTCAIVVTDPVVEGFTTGLVSNKPITGTDKQKMADYFEKNGYAYLSESGVLSWGADVSYSGGSNYASETKEIADINADVITDDENDIDSLIDSRKS